MSAIETLRVEPPKRVDQGRVEKFARELLDDLSESPDSDGLRNTPGRAAREPTCVVGGYARRPQVQERLTSQVTDTLVEALPPGGAAALIEGVHSCMTIRGVQKPGASMITSMLRGRLLEDAASRSEFLSLVRHVAA